MSKEYDNRGQVSLWRVKSKNPKAPDVQGTVIAHRDIREGEELDIALWKNESNNPKAPVSKGKISDKFEKRADDRMNDRRDNYRDDYEDDVPW